MRLLLIPPSHSLRTAFWSQAFILRGAVQLHAAAPNPTGLSDALAEMIKITLAHLNSLRQACGGPGGKLTLLCDLGSELQKIYSARPNKDMFISASPKLPYGDVVKVIDISKGAGVGDIGLLSEEIR